jgi:hypothetical protein
VLQQEVRLRRELEQPQRGQAASHPCAAAGRTLVHGLPRVAESKTSGAACRHHSHVSPSAPESAALRGRQCLVGNGRSWSVRRAAANWATVASAAVGSGGGKVAAAATRATARFGGKKRGGLSEVTHCPFCLRASRRRSRSGGGVEVALGRSQSRSSCPAVLPNPSLNTRPREAWRPCAAQGSRKLHCPARPKGGPPRGSPQLER